MAGGSSKTPKQKISPQEAEQAQRAAAKWNERIDDGFFNLEKAGVADARSDHSGVIGGRASADLALSERQGMRQIVSARGSTADASSFGRTIAGAETTRDVDAATQAQLMGDQRRVQMAKVGQDVALTAGAGLRDAASLGASRANLKVQNKITEDNAKFGAVMDMVGGAVSGAQMRAEGFRFGKGGLERTHERGLRGAKPLENPELEKKGNRLSYGSMIMGGF